MQPLSYTSGKIKDLIILTGMLETLSTQYRRSPGKPRLIGKALIKYRLKRKRLKKIAYASKRKNRLVCK